MLDISALVKEIRAIADQINLLTLTVAIKAALAGDQCSLLADRSGQVSGEFDAGTREVIASILSISITIYEQSIASQKIAQCVE